MCGCVLTQVPRPCWCAVLKLSHVAFRLQVLRQPFKELAAIPADARTALLGALDVSFEGRDLSSTGLSRDSVAAVLRDVTTLLLSCPIAESCDHGAFVTVRPPRPAASSAWANVLLAVCYNVRSCLGSWDRRTRATRLLSPVCCHRARSGARTAAVTAFCLLRLKCAPVPRWSALMPLLTTPSAALHVASAFSDDTTVLLQACQSGQPVPRSTLSKVWLARVHSHTRDLFVTPTVMAVVGCRCST